MNNHHLKTWRAPFAAVCAGLKAWELRKNDRDFKVGDTLLLEEWNEVIESYTGDFEVRTVIWMLEGPAFGLPEGYVIMSLSAPSSPRDGWVMVPREPTPGLLMSMAIRHDHGLGVPGYYDQDIFGAERIPHASRVRMALDEMRKVHEEVVGSGFYKPDREAYYLDRMGPQEPLTEDQFRDRFVAEMLRVGGKTFADGDSVEDYANDTWKAYWDEEHQRSDGPEACAQADVAEWGAE